MRNSDSAFYFALFRSKLFLLNLLWKLADTCWVKEWKQAFFTSSLVLCWGWKLPFQFPCYCSFCSSYLVHLFPTLPVFHQLVYIMHWFIWTPVVLLDAPSTLSLWWSAMASLWNEVETPGYWILLLLGHQAMKPKELYSRIFEITEYNSIVYWNMIRHCSIYVVNKNN